MLIKTRYLPPTKRHGALIRATGDDGSTLTIPFVRNLRDPHLNVAQALVRATYTDGFTAVHVMGNMYRPAETEHPGKVLDS